MEVGYNALACSPPFLLQTHLFFGAVFLHSNSKQLPQTPSSDNVSSSGGFLRSPEHPRLELDMFCYSCVLVLPSCNKKTCYLVLNFTETHNSETSNILERMWLIRRLKNVWIFRTIGLLKDKIFCILILILIYYLK